MRNPVLTRERILRQSAGLFNTRGYKATSIGDITKATGLTKGAVYRHFGSKAGLEKDTLTYLSTQMFDLVREKIRGEKTAGGKLRAIFRYFETYVTKPPLKGGCPLMNVAIEADDAHPVLRKRAVLILDALRDSIVTILENGIRFGQIRAGVDKSFYATLIIASLEGAIMMSKLRGNDHDIQAVTRHLEKQLAAIET
jgi:TetR/AcrR family transcriptional regulator, transcriptional repressor for nem operon